MQRNRERMRIVLAAFREVLNKKINNYLHRIE